MNKGADRENRTYAHPASAAARQHQVEITDEGGYEGENDGVKRIKEERTKTRDRERERERERERIVREFLFSRLLICWVCLSLFAVSCQGDPSSK